VKEIHVTVRSRSGWLAACAIGFAAGFPIFLVFTEAVFGHATMTLGFVGHLVGLAIFGTIVAASQAIALRDLSSGALHWMIAGAIGFALVTLVIFPLYYFRVWPTPLPIEPLVITLCAGVFAGTLQWWGERRSPSASRWLRAWIAGIVAGVVAGYAVMTLMSRLDIAIPFPLDMGVFGAVVGGIAGAISAAAMRVKLATSQE